MPAAIPVGHGFVTSTVFVWVTVVVTAGSVVATLTVEVDVVHGGVVSMQEQSVLTKELACWTSKVKSGSSESPGFVVVGLGTVHFLAAAQFGVTVTVVTMVLVRVTTGGVLLPSVYLKREGELEEA